MGLPGLKLHELKGMLAPLVAHVAADITIFAILAFIIFQYKDVTIA